MTKTVKWYSTFMSAAAAVIYILAGADILDAGDIRESGEAPPVIFYIAGAFYLFAGYLVHIEKKWLRLGLGIINALIISVFFQMWAGRPDVVTSAAGLGTKIAQFLLEIGLIYLIIKTWNRSPADRASAGAGDAGKD